MKNDSVLLGHVNYDGDFLVVRMNSGDEIRLRPVQVEAVYDSLAAAFAAKRQGIDSTDVDGQVRLAHWCLRHDFSSGAAQVLSDLSQKGIGDSRVVALERILKTHASGVSANVRTATKAQRPIQITEINSQSFERFERTVEPVLMQNCGASGCHGAGGLLAFRLLRRFPGKSSRLPSQSHNLKTTLHQIDSHDPLSSRLLRFANLPHGGMNGQAALMRESQEYQWLRDWVLGIGGGHQDNTTKREPVQPRQVALLQQPTHVAVTRQSPNEGYRIDRTNPKSADPYDPSPFNRRSRLR